MQLEFELAYYDVGVQHVSHYITRNFWWVILKQNNIRFIVYFSCQTVNFLSHLVELLSEIL